METRSFREDFLWQAASLGLFYAAPHAEDASRGLFSCVPMTHASYSIPRSAWEDVRSKTEIFGILMDRVCRDVQFLVDAHKEIAVIDDFVQRLVAILEQAYCSHSPYQEIMLSVFRNDFMLDVDKNGVECFKQVEINTIASSFAGLSQRVVQLHRYLSDRHGHCGVPLENFPVDGITDALASAHESFCCSFDIDVSKAVVLFIVQPSERNLVDQKSLETILWMKHRIPVVRTSLGEVQRIAELVDGASNTCPHLSISESKFVSVIYFRAGYTPLDYPTDEEWKARLMLEKSSAVKCPSVPMHLSGTKRIQQLLTLEDNLLKYLTPFEAEQLSKHFVPQYCLGERHREDVLCAVKEALHDGSAFVIKPQREGGGNLVVGDQAVSLLKSVQDGTCTDGDEYILMRKIQTSPQAGRGFFRDGVHFTADLLSEVGFYSTLLSRGDHVFRNDFAGYLVRSKVVGTAEGGVAAGASALDSIFLIDNIALDE